MQEPARTDADLVLAVRDGDPDAYGELFERWFDRVYDVAYGVLRDRDAAVDAAQDALVAGWQRLDRLDDPAAFGGWLLRIGRNRSLDLLRRRAHSRPSEVGIVTWHHDRGANDPVAGTSPEGPADAAARIERAEMLSAASTALGADDASLLDLHLRHGLTPAEIAEELGVTANAAHQKLFRMRDRLGRAIAAFLLWQRGRPRCAELAAALGGGPVFDAEVFGSIERHRRSCAECRDRSALMVAPERLFSALPIAVAPLAARSTVADALREAGVPLSDAFGAARTDRSGTRPSPEGGSPPYVDVGLVAAVLGGAPQGWVWATEPAAEARAGAAGRWRRHVSARRSMVAGIVVLLIGVVAGLTMMRSGQHQTSGALAPLGTSVDDTTTSAAPDSTAVRQGPGAPSAPVDRAERASSSSPSSTTSTSPTTTAPPAAAPQSNDPALQPPSPVPPAAPPPPPPAAPPPADPAPDQPPPDPAPPPPDPAPDPAQDPPPDPAPDPPPPAPTILRFTVAAGDPVLLCMSPSQSPRRFGWATEGGSSATLLVGGIPRQAAPSGSLEVCAGSGQTATLTVSGAGGTASANLVVP